MINNKMEKRLSLVPDESSLATVSDFLDECLDECAVPIKQGYRLKVIADELYSNIVYYSGAKNAGVYFACDGTRIELCFSDDGARFNPLEAEEPDLELSPAEMEPGGLGILLVRNMADEMEYEYVSGENRMNVVLMLADEAGEGRGALEK